ncbi:helix-turn-helix transcriptional regulator [Paracoccus caeni]|uniref:Helix-turn-helix transcriptional regulator n=1 Tax=Paracoccus caeni TaxID=657651 RepID=A0A934VZ12_9RHOB|nr:helix-turn-helix transcriptional regulator [Paracoccus caeni]MBK4215340.1 helix-turn-helix transcriptional regulator [Paracoccus caeni]
MMSDYYGYGPDEATLGDRLTAAREAAGYTVEQMAERLGLGVDTIEGWEVDQAAPSDEGLGRIAILLSVSADWLQRGEGAGLVTPDADDLATELVELRRLLQEALQRLTRLEGQVNQ